MERIAIHLPKSHLISVQPDDTLNMKIAVNIISRYTDIILTTRARVGNKNIFYTKLMTIVRFQQIRTIPNVSFGHRILLCQKLQK